MLVAMAIAVAAILFLYNAIEGEGGYKDQLEAERAITERVDGISKYRRDLARQNREIVNTRRDPGEMPTRPELLARAQQDRVENERLRRTYGRGRGQR
jgi:hypothetical protein